MSKPRQALCVRSVYILQVQTLQAVLNLYSALSGHCFIVGIPLQFNGLYSIRHYLRRFRLAFFGFFGKRSGKEEIDGALSNLRMSFRSTSVEVMNENGLVP